MMTLALAPFCLPFEKAMKTFHYSYLSVSKLIIKIYTNEQYTLNRLNRIKNSMEIFK